MLHALPDITHNISSGSQAPTVHNHILVTLRKKSFMMVNFILKAGSGYSLEYGHLLEYILYIE